MWGAGADGEVITGTVTPSGLEGWSGIYHEQVASKSRWKSPLISEDSLVCSYWEPQWEISLVPLSKRIQVQYLSYENEFDLCETEPLGEDIFIWIVSGRGKRKLGNGLLQSLLYFASTKIRLSTLCTSSSDIWRCLVASSIHFHHECKRTKEEGHLSMFPHHHSTRGRESEVAGDPRYHSTCSCRMGLIGSFHGHMVQNHTCWGASCTVELPKQRQVKVDWCVFLGLGSVTFQLASQNVCIEQRAYLAVRFYFLLVLGLFQFSGILQNLLPCHE